MIENANAGNQKAALKILEAAYGVRGKVRHRLLYASTRVRKKYLAIHGLISLRMVVAVFAS